MSDEVDKRTIVNLAHPWVYWDCKHTVFFDVDAKFRIKMCHCEKCGASVGMDIATYDPILRIQHLILVHE
jgi:hypothetical protein